MISPGSDVVSSMISGYPEGRLSMVYGPGASGKTTACLLALIECVSSGNKAIFIDTENGFDSARFSQLAGEKASAILKNTFLIRVNSFDEQRNVFRKLPELSSVDKVKLIIVDSIGNHYRLALKKNHYMANNAMAKHLKILSKLGKAGKAILATNQVYQNIEKGNEITIVGGNMVRDKMDCLIEFVKDNSEKRYAILRKHYADTGKENMPAGFEIRQEGMFLC